MIDLRLAAGLTYKCIKAPPEHLLRILQSQKAANRIKIAERDKSKSSKIVKLCLKLYHHFYYISLNSPLKNFLRQVQDS